MKSFSLAILAGAGVAAWFYFRKREPVSLREDKPAPELPKSSEILEGRAKQRALFNLPTEISGVAPAWKWDFGTVANIFAQGSNA